MPSSYARCSSAVGELPATCTRRQVLKAIGVGVGAILLSACGGGGGARGSVSPATSTPNTDFAARFNAFQAAPEPNGDLSRVVWPEFVTQAGPEVRRLYEFQVENGELMRYMPCFCGCGGDGHRNNRDCYIKAVNDDGSVVFDSMAPT